LFFIFTLKLNLVKPTRRSLSSLFFVLLLSVSCGQGDSKSVDLDSTADTLVVESLEDALSQEVNDKKRLNDSIELKESIKKIEAKYGEQWDFCDCVVKGDSINKAFLKPNLPDKEFDRLSKRFDEIDEKCQAFRIQDANRTPEERIIHEKKVKKCLRAAGIKK
jgi:hypothetical protein